MTNRDDGTATLVTLGWNRCDICGEFIAMKQFDIGKAIRRMLTPDSEYTGEEYETLCPKHRDA